MYFINYKELVSYRFYKQLLKKFFFFNNFEAKNFFFFEVSLYNVKKKKYLLFFSFLDDFCGQVPSIILNKKKAINTHGIKSFNENLVVVLRNKALINNFILFLFFNHISFTRNFDCFLSTRRLKLTFLRKLFLNISCNLRVKVLFRKNLLENYIFLSSIKSTLLK